LGQAVDAKRFIREILQHHRLPLRNDLHTSVSRRLPT
jgi:hypothetical protein